MFVLSLMTGVTAHRGVFVAIVCMAVPARHLDMLVAELVAGLIMIKPDLLPIPIRVAVSACASYFSFMRIVFLVAAVTIGRCVAIFDLGCVTGLALDLPDVGMSALEREVCPFVIEGLLRNRSDILPSSLVVRVALLAFALLLESPVRSLLLLDVLPNVLVTILAERILCRLVEPLVTLGTVFFPFGMTVDHLAGHQSRFNVVCPGRFGHEHERAEQTNEQVVG
jgi:hypothetical protein